MRLKLEYSKGKIAPLTLCLSLVVLDRLTKLLVSLSLPESLHSEAALTANHVSALRDLIWIVHIKNSLYMFGIAQRLNDAVQSLLFGFLPTLAILLLVVIYLLSTYRVSLFRTVTFSVLVAGALGNEIDRMLYSGRVVDFIGLRFLRRLGIVHWPIINIADALVAVSVILLLFSLLKEAVFAKATK
jgi:signal peptidase II